MACFGGVLDEFGTLGSVDNAIGCLGHVAEILALLAGLVETAGREYQRFLAGVFEVACAVRQRVGGIHGTLGCVPVMLDITDLPGEDLQVPVF